MGKTLNETKHKNNFDIQVQCISRILDSENSEADCLLIVNGSNEFELPVDILVDDKEFPKALAKNKIAVKREQRTNLQNYLIEEYNRLKSCNSIVYRHTRLGWMDWNGNTLFLSEHNEFHNSKLNCDCFSDCSREDFLFRNGTEQIYNELLYKTVFASTHLTLAVAIGLSAVITSRLKDKLHIGAMIFNFCGITSTGKTTAAMLATSLFAAPNKQGLLFSFNATNNALTARLNNIHGLPMVIDDILEKKIDDISPTIYSLAEGSNKDRCTSNGRIKTDSNSNFSGTIILTSEYPVLECGNKNNGLLVRVLGTNDIVWTPDAATADFIQETVTENYGWTGIAFANYIEPITLNELYSEYKNAKTALRNFMPNFDGLTDRLEKQYAIIFLTLEYMNSFFSLSFDCKALISILLDAENKHLAGNDNADKALEAVKEFIIKHNQNFDVYKNETRLKDGIILYKTNISSHKNNYYGVIIIDGFHTDFYLLSEITKEIIKNAGIRDILSVQRTWKKAGIINCEKNRYDCKCFYSLIPNKRYFRFSFCNDDCFSESSRDKFCTIAYPEFMYDDEMYEPPEIPQYALDFFKDFDEYSEENYNG